MITFATISLAITISLPILVNCRESLQKRASTHSTYHCATRAEELQGAIEHPPSAFHILKLDKSRQTLAHGYSAGIRWRRAIREAVGSYMFIGVRPMQADHLELELMERLEERHRQRCEEYVWREEGCMLMIMCIGNWAMVEILAPRRWLVVSLVITAT